MGNYECYRTILPRLNQARKIELMWQCQQLAESKMVCTGFSKICTLWGLYFRDWMWINPLHCSFKKCTMLGTWLNVRKGLSNDRQQQGNQPRIHSQRYQ